MEEVLDRAGIIASLRTPEVDFVRDGAGHVRQLWEVLRLEAERRSVLLDAVLQAQQYYSEAAKVESSLAVQKLRLINEDKGTVRLRVFFFVRVRSLVPRSKGLPVNCSSCLRVFTSPFRVVVGRGEHPAASERAPFSGAHGGELRRGGGLPLSAVPATSGARTP